MLYILCNVNYKIKKFKIFLKVPIEASISLKFLAKSSFLHKIVGKLLEMVRLNRLRLESGNSYIRSSGRAAEGDGLENRCTERYRGFESLLLRFFYKTIRGKCRLAIIKTFKSTPPLFWIRNKHRQITKPYLQSA